jgi:hypothetical protein
LQRKPNEDFTRNPFDWSYRANDETPAFTSMRQILHPRELPDVRGLSDLEVIGLLNDVEFELMQKHILVDFLDDLPPRVAYKGILQLLDTPLEQPGLPHRIQHLDGCDSACESCFQLAFCPIAKEILGSEWRLAVEQANINPSWSALFSEDRDAG